MLPNGLEFICGGCLLDWMDDEIGTMIGNLQNTTV